MTLHLKFTRIIDSNKALYEPSTTFTTKLCEVEGLGTNFSETKVITERQLQALKEKYGANEFIILERPSEVRFDEFTIYREEYTNKWIGILLNKDATEIKPYFQADTKYKLLFTMLQELMQQKYERE